MFLYKPVDLCCIVNMIQGGARVSDCLVFLGSLFPSPHHDCDKLGNALNAPHTRSTSASRSDVTSMEE